MNYILFGDFHFTNIMFFFGGVSEHRYTVAMACRVLLGCSGWLPQQVAAYCLNPKEPKHLINQFLDTVGLMSIFLCKSTSFFIRFLIHKVQITCILAQETNSTPLHNKLHYLRHYSCPLHNQSDTSCMQKLTSNKSKK